MISDINASQFFLNFSSCTLYVSQGSQATVPTEYFLCDTEQFTGHIYYIIFGSRLSKFLNFKLKK